MRKWLKKYKCPQCPSSFKRPENLKRHQRGHDENRRFTCQICDKSFARSDILSRHVAIHMPSERQDDNPQRRRACHECARVRGRCSRGEPCRRCATKALRCLYPEEPRFKITMPHTRSSSISEPDDHDATGVGGPGPDSTLGSPRDSLLRNHGSSHWQVERSPASFREQYIISSSVFPHNSLDPYLASHHKAHFASFFRYDALSPQDEGFYAGSTIDINTDDMKFIAGDTEPDGISRVYCQTTHMPSKLMSSLNRVGNYQPSPSAELQGNYTDRSPLNDGHFNIPFDAYSSSSSTHTALLGQPEILVFSGTPVSQGSLASVQAPNVDLDNQGTHFHSLQIPYSPLGDLKDYDSITTAFADSSQNKNQSLPFDAPTTASRTSQHGFFPTLYFNHLKHHEDADGGTPEAPGGFEACFENSYIP
ncbi:hypothetical protein F4801DRAFT_564074 [Xylaria longipes]|nr:hypothetical protein F4801DRAFT_564074 [Xylaria longipes]